MGGEAVRVALLTERLPAEAAGAFVAMAAMAQFCGQVLFVLTGLPFAGALLPDGPLRTGLFARLGGAPAAARDRPATRVLGEPRAPGPRAGCAGASARVERSGAALASRARRGARPSPRAPRPIRLAACALLAWQSGVLETWIVLRLLHQRVGLSGPT